jgi:hypothetical protein
MVAAVRLASVLRTVEAPLVSIQQHESSLMTPVSEIQQAVSPRKVLFTGGCLF